MQTNLSNKFGVRCANYNLYNKYKCIGGQIDSACSATGAHPVPEGCGFCARNWYLFVYNQGGEHRLNTQTLEPSHNLLTLVFITKVECWKDYERLNIFIHFYINQLIGASLL